MDDQRRLQKLNKVAKLILSNPRDAVDSEIFNLYSVTFFNGTLSKLHFDTNSPIINLLPESSSDYSEDSNFIVFTTLTYQIIVDKE